jgi:hypothetical protein
LAWVFLWAVPSVAQLQVGNNLNLHLNGTASAGYNADYGDNISSDHSLGFGGTGAASGYYYNPNFLSFGVIPFYNQARDNSTYNSISNASGVTAQTAIFSGSSFPGSVSYSNIYNGEGSYNIPGLANYTTHGNSDGIGIAWGEHLAGLPSLSVSFQRSSSQNTIYGAQAQDSSTSDNFNLHGNYRLAGFNLGANYYTGSSNSEFPELLAGGQDLTSNSNTTSHGYGFNVGHSLPWNGSANANYNDSTVDSNFLGTSESYTVRLFNAAASMQPSPKLHVSVTMGYSDNLTGSIEQAVIAAGGVATQQAAESEPSNAYNFAGIVSYALMPNLQMQGEAERRVQTYLGTTYGANTYSGTVSYWHGLFGGIFNTAGSIADSTGDNTSNNSIGFTGNANYNRQIGEWHVNSSFNYAQNTQTLFLNYTTSSYGYGANIRRRWRFLGWSLGGGGSHSGLTGISGTTSSSESVSSSLMFGRFLTTNGSYSTSSGTGILTPSGIVASPVPSPLLPTSSVLLYGGHSYSFSLASSPLRRMTLAASYAKADSNTGSGLNGSTNTTEIFNTLLQYQFRKMYFTSGYSRLTQGFSASGLPSQTICSYYFGVSRWFNFF